MREPHRTQKPDKTSKDVRIPTIHVIPPQDYISSDGFWGEERQASRSAWKLELSCVNTKAGWGLGEGQYGEAAALKSPELTEVALHL